MMKNEPTFDITIVGTGIVGLALAWQAAKRGLKVAMFERHPRAIGATVRNFGMIWPLGQPLQTFDRAMRSRATWLELSKKANFWAAESGALCLAYHEDEMQVLQEFFETRQGSGYQIQLLSPAETLVKSQSVHPTGLKGALWSATEVNVDPRQATQQIHVYLREKMGVQIFYNTAITQIDNPWLSSGNRSWQAEQIFVCSGADFETLFPEVFAQSGITKCKLQMMRTQPQTAGWSLGPTLCGGLTLQHYGAFAHCESLKKLKKRFAKSLPDYTRWGIHVLVSQTAKGEVTIGDSHEYGLDVSPFDRDFINQLILDYLETFAVLPNLHLAETWHGVYPKLKGSTEFVQEVEPGVTIVNGLGGAGMTLAFGLAEEIFARDSRSVSAENYG
ncbi:MAG: TIGR03364 family FAD-dependent oxidoreductase [Bacteroidota bacterium]